MSAPGPHSMSRSPMWLAVTVIVDVFCVALAVSTRNVGLACVGVLGLGAVTWQIATRKKRLAQEPMTQAEAAAYLRPRRGRYTVTFAAIGAVSVLTGLAILVAGIEGPDPTSDFLGALGIAVGAAFFSLVVRLHHRLRTDRDG